MKNEITSKLKRVWKTIFGFARRKFSRFHVRYLLTNNEGDNWLKSFSFWKLNGNRTSWKSIGASWTGIEIHTRQSSKCISRQEIGFLFLLENMWTASKFIRASCYLFSEESGKKIRRRKINCSRTNFFNGKQTRWKLSNESILKISSPHSEADRSARELKSLNYSFPPIDNAAPHYSITQSC